MNKLASIILINITVIMGCLCESNDRKASALYLILFGVFLAKRHTEKYYPLEDDNNE